MKAKIELTESDIRDAILAHIHRQLGLTIPREQFKVQVKSKQDYRSEWEEAAIRCDFEADVRG